MKILLISLFFFSHMSSAQGVIDKYATAACACTENKGYAEIAREFRESSTENERFVYDKIKEEYWTAKRCIQDELKRTLTEEDQNGRRPKEHEFSDALTEKCPDVEFVFAKCKQIDYAIFREELDAEVKADFDEIQKVFRAGDLDSTFKMWDEFHNFHGAENTYTIEYIVFTYETERFFYGNLMSKVLIRAVENGIVVDYRDDKSTPVNEFIVNSIRTLAEKYGQGEIVTAVNEIKIPQE